MKNLTSKTPPAAFKFAFWLFAFAIALSAEKVSASELYVVGSCKSGKETQFLTIQSAVNSVPSGATVEICPGKYFEQINVTKPITLQGITAPNQAMVQILLPNDYGQNTVVRTASGEIYDAVAQINVKDVEGGNVNLENLEVNGQGYGMKSTLFLGILYEQASGTINQVVTDDQNDNAVSGVTGFGIWLQGGAVKESVTVENSSIHDFSTDGIYVAGVSPTPDFAVTIKNNNFAADLPNAFNLDVEAGADPTVSGNVMSGGYSGIAINTNVGSITENVILGNQYGVLLGDDGVSLTSNKILDSTLFGIYIYTNALKSTIESNIIASASAIGTLDGFGIGIELNCVKTTSSHFKSNTLMDLGEGYGSAPAGFTSSDTFAGVFTQIETCSGSDSRSKDARVKLHPTFLEN